MRRINNNPNSPLLFAPFGGPMNVSSMAVNHGIDLPQGKAILENGLFILGNLQTTGGRNVEAALRKSGSFAFHLCALDAGLAVNYEPIRLFPNPEPNDEVLVPEDLFSPYYNCHGHSFADDMYWINPLASEMQNGQMVLTKPNVDIILEDEFIEVEENEDWDIGILRNNNGLIVHSVRNNAGVISTKFDGYRLVSSDNIHDLDFTRYGNVLYEYYLYN